MASEDELAHVDRMPDGDENGSSKKRSALRQLTKDDDPDMEDQHEVSVGSGFKKAPDEVLAKRKIVKIRRGPAPSAPSGPNPFAAIQFVAPDATAVSTTPTTAPTTLVNAAPRPSEAVIESIEAPAASASVSVTSPLESAVHAGEVSTTSSAGVTTTATDSSSPAKSLPETPVPTDTAISNVADTGDEKKPDDDKITLPVPNSSNKDDTEGEKDKPSVPEAQDEKQSNTSSQTFQQLSSSTNAFAGSFGTGFSNTAFSFGATSSSFSTGLAFTFGSSSSSSSSTFMSFGSSAASSTNAFGSKSPGDPGFSSIFGVGNNGSMGTASTIGGTTSSTQPPPPAVVLQEVQVETGEEKETAVFAGDATLYEFVEKAWKERGKGEIRVNISKEGAQKPRLVMRSKGNLRLLLNANLYPDMLVNKMDNKSVSFACINSAATEKPSLTTYAVKLKDMVVSTEFVKVVKAHLGESGSKGDSSETALKEESKVESKDANPATNQSASDAPLKEGEGVC